MFGPPRRACTWRSDWRTRSIPTRKLVSRKDSGRPVPRRLPVSRSTAWLVRIWNTSPGGKNPHPSLIVESPNPRKPLGRTPRMLLSLIGIWTALERYPVASDTAARANVDFHVSPRAAGSLATGYLSSAVRMPINDNNILGVLPSGFLGFGDSTINDGWGFFPPGDVFQIRTSQAVERLTGSLRGTWRPLSFLETSFLVGMDRVRQSDRQLQARGEGPNIAGLRLGRVLAGRANSDHYSNELGGRAAFHLSPALAPRPAVGPQYFHATGDTLLRLRPGVPPGGTRPPDAARPTGRP